MVLPGRIGTGRVAEIDSNRARATGQDVEAVRAQSISTIPAGRYGTPQEFASAAVFLCGEPASYITGSRVRVDGGMIAGH
jgi:3-oxoacyl-[acyl-carrier protein] reductase